MEGLRYCEAERPNQLSINDREERRLEMDDAIAEAMKHCHVEGGKLQWRP